MADIICGPCGVKMQKEKSGLKIKLPNGYCQHGDLFKCPRCTIEVIGDIGRAHRDNDPDRFDIELKRWDG